MNAVELEIAGLWLITPTRHEDERGFFMETYNRKALADIGVDCDFVQDNQSLSRQAGTLRGLHYQKPPMAQSKLVRVLRGRIHDVCVDLRRGSSSFGRHVGVELSADRGDQLFVPVGLAHGFCTLEPDTEVAYKVDAFYAPDHEGGLAWDDASLAIDWPVAPDAVAVSPKDAALPAFSPDMTVFR